MTYAALTLAVLVLAVVVALSALSLWHITGTVAERIRRAIGPSPRVRRMVRGRDGYLYDRD